MVCSLSSDETVFEWDSEGKGNKIASSFTSFLEAYRNDLLANKFEFDGEFGLTEKMGGGAPRGGERKSSHK